MGVLVVLLVVVAVVGVTLFLRAVFGGSTFPRERRRGRKDDDAGRGPRADAHAGAGRWAGGGGLGTFGTWNASGGGD